MIDSIKSKNKRNIGYLVIGCGLFLTISILAYQFYQWLKNGEWFSIPLYKPLQFIGLSFDSLLDLEWIALQKFIFWILEQPLAGFIGISSLAIGWIMTMRS